MLSQTPPGRHWTASKLIELGWETAWEAAIQAFLALLLGTIALGIVGDIFKDMTPSPPPGFGGTPQLEADPAVHRHTTHGAGHEWSLLNAQHFWALAVILFVLGMWRRLRQANDASVPQVTTRRQKIFNNLSEDWFGLVVSNAFGAMVSAMVLVWVQRFSWSQMLWQWLWEITHPTLQPLAQSLLGTSRLTGLERWWAWYGENQFRFAFWLFYVAAICDDLGVPNFKTLGRWLSRRWRRRSKPAPSAVSAE